MKSSQRVYKILFSFKKIKSKIVEAEVILLYNESLKSEKLLFEIDKIENKLDENIIIDDWEKIETLNDEVKFLTPIKVFLDIKKTSRGFDLTGKVETKLMVNCSRCLNSFEYNVENDILAYYINKDFEKELNKTEHLSSLENIIYYENDSIDLTDRVIEAIILAVPEKPLCSKNCKGLCTICGENLNENPDHSCEQDEVDPRLKDLLKLIEKEDK